MRKIEKTRKRRRRKKKGLRIGGSSFEEEDIRGDLEGKKNVSESMGEDRKGKEDKNREQIDWNVLEREA